MTRDERSIVTFTKGKDKYVVTRHHGKTWFLVIEDGQCLIRLGAKRVYIENSPDIWLDDETGYTIGNIVTDKKEINVFSREQRMVSVAKKPWPVGFSKTLDAVRRVGAAWGYDNPDAYDEARDDAMMDGW